MNVVEILRTATGLTPDLPTLERALRTRMRKLGMAAHADYARLLDGPELDELAELVVVPESWMFRDPAAFHAATSLVQRRVARDPAAVVRILSAPCAGGEEPYSMAMALQDAGVAAARYSIDAIDLSAASIRRARAARYTANAFRGEELEFRDRYFKADGKGYVLREPVRGSVHFRRGNLLDLGADAARYDIIFCRNLLIYFDDAAIGRAAAVLSTLLADGGMLLAGPAEAPALCRHGFARLPLPGAFALYKTSQPPAELAVRPMASRRVAGVSLKKTLPDGQSAAGLLGIARRHAESGRWREAVRTCHGLLALEPTEAGAWFILGQASRHQGDVRAAERHWRRCLYLAPRHHEVLGALAQLAEHDGEAGRAAVYRQRAARLRSGA
ncbi:CheR family methyltransferase [Massilia terrae]|uniref:Methyltransferase n=1 Tax=Massilia terrae TaxID=1811224 RepID=A0ABT2D4N4_9BURK|nr:CheR family methyltransferase [Massilia terrae]MCS0660741.1 methyltransferase [Massilia terrae]